MIDLSKLIPAIPQLFNMMDIDVSVMEKIENKIRMNRKKTVLFFIAFMLVSCCCFLAAFYLNKYFGSISYLIPVGFLFLLFFIVNVTVKKKAVRMAKKGIAVNLPEYFITGFVLIVTILLITLLIQLYNEIRINLTVPNFIGFIMLILLIGLFLYMIYHILLVKIKTPNEVYYFSFYLVSGEQLDVILTSITKRGDYVVKILNNDKYPDHEILINYLQIEKIIFIAKLESETPGFQDQEDNMERSQLSEALQSKIT